MNNLKSGNSFSAVEADLLLKHLRDLKGIDGVVFESEGPGPFCSGGDLIQYASHTRASQGHKINRLIRKALDQLDNLNVPTVAVVEGDCFGGGVELLSAFDHVISTSQVHFGFWQRKIGLTFGWGGYLRLRKRMSESELKNKALVTTGFSSFEALDSGLINEISPAYEIEKRALDWLAKASSWSKESLVATKLSVKKDANQEAKIFEKLWFNKDHLKAMKNFMASRRTEN